MKLRGKGTNTDAIGAVVRVKAGRLDLLRVVQSGIRFTVFVDLVFVRHGRAVADAAFTSTGVPFGEAAETATIGRMSARMSRPPT